MYLRKCVSCGKQSNKFDFIRINKVKDKFLNFKIFISDCGCKNYIEGRTAYLCPCLECLKIAKKKSRIERNLKCKIDPEVYDKIYNLISKNC